MRRMWKPYMAASNLDSARSQCRKEVVDLNQCRHASIRNSLRGTNVSYLWKKENHLNFEGDMYGYVSSLEGTLDAVLAKGPENIYRDMQSPATCAFLFYRPICCGTFATMMWNVYPHRDLVGVCVQRCIS